MGIYTNFALLYDQLMSDSPYDEWIKFTNYFLANKKVEKVVDLGCGTGEITVRLAKQYDEIYGVDQSTDMLTIAHHKAIEKNVPHITWIEQDIRNLTGFSNVDVFISYCDVINYIVELDDLQNLFQNVYNSLAKNGLFMFDIHSMEHVEKNLTDQTFAYKNDELAYIWYCSSGETKGEMFHDMTFFYRHEQETVYERFEEIHHQRTYDLETYEQLLRQADFHKINFYADFSVEKAFSEKNSERIFIVAEK